MSIKRLFADIEVLPNQGFFFSCGWKKNIMPEAITKERCIICIAYMWEGEKRPTILRFDENQCDREMLSRFIKVANEADEIVWQYGDNFDGPWIRTRALFHRLPPFPLWKTVDTKKLASKHFYFNSNKLDYMSQFMGFGGKLETKFELWKQVAANNEKAINYMCKYCAVDVLKLRNVYATMIPYCSHKTHAGVLAGGEKWTSPFTGGKNVKKNMTKVTANGTRQHQMQCLDTGRYYCINEATFAAYQEAKKKEKTK